MKTRRKRGGLGARGNSPFQVLFFLLVMACLGRGAEPIPSGQVIDWDPGVRGGIPIRETISDTLPNTSTAAEIQTALNSCPSNQVVELEAGTFSINATITVPTGRTLRGQGMGVTILAAVSGFSGSSIISFNAGFDSGWGGTVQDISALTKGDTTLTTSGTHGWSVNHIVLIDMLEQPAGDPPIDNTGSLGTCTWCGRASTRPFGQLVRVTAVPTTTSIEFDPPAYWSYDQTPQAVRMRTTGGGYGITDLAGVEGLTIDGHGVQVQDSVTTFGAVNCWLYEVEIKGVHRRALWGYNALWFQMSRCIVREARPAGADHDAQYMSDRAYGPFLGPHFSAGLITDSIMEKLTMGVAFEGAAAGNVISYNLMTNIWWMDDDPGDAPRRFGPLMHGPHPFMNLLEGNYSCGRVRADEYWGTSSHFTVFRNRVIQIDRGEFDAQNWTIDIERKNWYWNFVGNLLGGSPGVAEDNYEYINGEAAPYSTSVSTIWKLGYESLGEDETLYDTDGLNSTLRWANWSHRTNDSVSGSGIVWHTANVVDTGNLTNFAASYYLDSKPSFMGALEWPPYDITDPDDNSVTNIPAGHRYYLGTEAPASEGGGGEPAAGRARAAGGVRLSGGGRID